ncbi:NUDIX domain-containing protein [Dyadobacter sp. CY356]|uniref:NUDIX domain-containing protein n=1 Tax=Dyadobacter sp. CY356 TaxID=2906442 RepID=UPI001F401C9F|nr:NUDIX hydrolase [Dyadobacter sp. CY356]MCF0059373.1 NUDIX hydrolase [Dyadobacter sp. CY356]
MKVRPAVVIVKEGTVLTMRYVYGEKEVYALPGGNPDPDECLPEALLRELMEELGVTVEVGEMAFCGEVLWGGMKKETLHMVFNARIVSGNPALNPAETTALEMIWLPFEELDQKLMYPNVGKHILQYLNGNLKSSYVGVIDQPFVQ